MTSYLGMHFKVSMNGGRKLSLLERQVIFDARTTEIMGYEVPVGIGRLVLTYSPPDDITKKIRGITNDQEVEAHYQAAILSAESSFASTRNAPPLRGINLRVSSFSYLYQGARQHQTTVAQTIADSKVMYNLPSGIARPGLPSRKIDLVKQFSYRDWKDPKDILHHTSPESLFVAHLQSASINPNRRKVQLSLQRANLAYTPEGSMVYTSAGEGFLLTLQPDTAEMHFLDHKDLHDGQRLPALAALLASAEHVENYLDIAKDGALDCMSPNTRHQARYRLRVLHSQGYDFQVELRMGDAINGNSFGPLITFEVNTEERHVQEQEK